ncbi:protein SAWADEE HOMEODOMAIN HOMOLOG 2-like [Phalaenopsis equestris]|uniref:protein SAWADEE HOMEODOMAIN HOMOLOG 2-like n=1 Tax=Phalaenopsis equestris TaxID=78828 RepID=UPI0009E560D2|nr:protein SAWADEE HOMEODOMAIN HOMOLOG 2-like [Phalaenopsis equestris]
MGRPPHGGGPAFRFTANEVMEMETCLQDVNNLSNSIPPRETICVLAEKFSMSAERAGKVIVQPKQVLNWFQNRRYAYRAKVKEPAKLNVSPLPRDDPAQFRNVAPPLPTPQGSNSSENVEVEFEAKSLRDGAWYDVSAFLSYRMFETGDPEVRIRFTGFGVEEDEWINVRKCVRQRSLPCEAGECVAVLPGDLILCFQEGNEQALYFDAHILDAQRRRHDVRGCRCRFLVRYDHDQSEEIVSLKKICRRPETDRRLELLQSSIAPGSGSGSADAAGARSSKNPSQPHPSKDQNTMISKRTRKQRKLVDVNVDEVMTIALPALSNLAVSAAPLIPTQDESPPVIGDNSNVAANHSLI